MRLLRFIIISILVLFLALAGLSLLIPSQVHLSRAINVGAETGTIMDQIKNLEEWKHWYPGFDSMDLSVQHQSGDRWQSVKTGGTTISITDTSSNSVTALFSNESRKPVLCTWQVITYGHTDSTTLQWYMDFKLHWYPWEKLASLLFEKKYGPPMEEGLARLKKHVESEGR